jgi:Zn-dependent membrane protease YugP
MLGLDMQYVLLVLVPSLVIGGLATLMVKTTFAKYSRIGSRRGYTGAEAAAEMLRRQGVQGVTIELTHGFLGDHYDPLSRTLRLSQDVYASRSLAAIGVACHEAGHAIQHARSFAPLWLRTAMVWPATLCRSS